MASSKVGVLAGCKGCSSPPFSSPPPYSVQVEEEVERRTRISPPLYSKGMLVGGLIQDERGSQDEKTKLLVVPSDDQKPLLGRNDPLSNDTARPRTPSVVRALFGNGSRRVSKLRLVEEELEALKQSSAARISALEGQLRAADAAAVAASHAATTAATVASYAADTAAATAGNAADTAAATAGNAAEIAAAVASYAAETAAAAAGYAAQTAAATAAAAVAAAIHANATAAHKIELLEYKLLTEARIFEYRLEAAESSAKESTRIARLEERISVASLRGELNSLRNPLVPGPRRNFSS